MQSEQHYAEFSTAILNEVSVLQKRIDQLTLIAGMDPDRFGNVILKAKQVWYEEEVVWKWLCRPLLRLNDRSPLQAVVDGDSADVMAILGSIMFGSFS